MTEKKEDHTYVNFQMTSDCNKLLTEAAKKSGRTKRQEAKFRLASHLEQFGDQSWEFDKK